MRKPGPHHTLSLSQVPPSIWRLDPRPFFLVPSPPIANGPPTWNEDSCPPHPPSMAPLLGTKNLGPPKGFFVEESHVLPYFGATKCSQLDMQDYFGDKREVYHGRKCLLSLFEQYCILHGGALSAVRVQCKRSATIWACGRTRDPYFVILGGHHCCLRVGIDTSSTLGIWHFWTFT